MNRYHIYQQYKSIAKARQGKKEKIFCYLGSYYAKKSTDALKLASEYWEVPALILTPRKREIS